MRQDLNEIPARGEGQRERQEEGDDDFQAHLFQCDPQFPVFAVQRAAEP